MASVPSTGCVSGTAGGQATRTDRAHKDGRNQMCFLAPPGPGYLTLAAVTVTAFDRVAPNTTVQCVRRSRGTMSAFRRAPNV
jgi:hypothetical protein